MTGYTIITGFWIRYCVVNTASIINVIKSCIVSKSLNLEVQVSLKNILSVQTNLIKAGTKNHLKAKKIAS